MKFLTCCASLLLSSLAAAPVQAADTPESLELASRFRAAEAWVDQSAMSQLTPAATVAVVSGQDIVWSHAYGYANLEARKAAEPGTAFSICSISKLFTSVAVMDLVDQGKVDLDAELGDYLADFDIAAPEGMMADPITIRGLLSHSAGMPREGDGAYWNTMDFPSEQALEDTLDELGRLYSPFTHYQYSNIGMSLLGKVVSEVSGTEYSAYVEQEIFTPLQLDTMTTDMSAKSYAENMAHGYYEFDASGQREEVPPYQLDGLAPAGGFTASVIDLSRFASWQFRLLDGGDEEVLKRTTLKNMHKVHWYDPYDSSSRIYGLGFSHFTFDDTPMIGHGGYCIGQRAHFAMDTRKEIAVSAMVNAENTSPEQITSGVFGLTAEAIVAASEADEAEDAERLADVMALQEFEGAFRWPKSPMGFYVIPLANGEIDTINLYSPSPASGVLRFQRIEGDRFRRVRDDGDLGEELVFERDSEGQVSSFYTEGYRYSR